MPKLDFETEHVYADHPTGGIVLSVELRTKHATRLLAHVDTGAANCLFTSDYAELLGLTLADGIPLVFSAAGGGRITAYGHPVTITVLGHSVHDRVLH